MDKTRAPNSMEGVWDPNKYIRIDEVQPGMEAYCLTGYKGTKVEKFDLDVLSVVRNVEPGRDAILVQGTDERFIHTGPVWGCSGSPVYINGRLAGALAFAWSFSKDPLYGVTPIEDMLKVGQGTPNATKAAWEPGFALDFSKPIVFAEIDRQITSGPVASKSQAGMTTLRCPLITSGLPAGVVEQLNKSVEPFGLMAVAGIGGGSTNVSPDEDVKLVPGASLVVPVVTGDIAMEAIGTVTEVKGDKVYGFGHSFLGYGPIDLPMATGQVHTVVSSVARSFKFGSAHEIIGALTTDESAAVFGQIGLKAKMIPLTITVDRYNDTEKRVYNCQLANNQLLTPMVLRTAVAGAALYLGDLPPEHMIEYKVNIGIEGADPITFENVSTNFGLNDLIIEGAASVALLMNNPYEKVDIESIDFDVRIAPKDISSRIWSVNLSDSSVKAGQEIKIGVVVESFLAGKKKYRYSLKIPDELAPGKYNLIVSGGYGYEKFLRKTVPYRFVSQSLETLIEAMNNLLAIERDQLYCLLVLPSGGVALEKAELPDLPATKVLVLQDTKRTLRSQPYSHWLEKSFHAGTVVVNEKVMQITVEK
ncbi:MAG: SpoIVB peptidase S55 domain-containing protein [Planctomycetota bacterium]